ncbi:hypothetical protein qu_869 [Acanthamoeba polyphaga mimivirus]|uniref:Ankyrin repeat protein n=1 Tax=Acanthamoeba polyphaga mimivirus TaxID=212035 RepID=A0A0G2Y759_MIMIV|nr:hypothetical protein [Acanthamoeba polyphaga mimivirus]QTF49760.1 hypothetical protein MIMI_R819 [Mimivirus reunion]WMV62203.1 hypothetical protein qu_869 [Mimivirus sp.]WMV63180.1 hypothetical protein qu_869 [Acanthamoeba polyphaga mimivirus]WMV64157.1 hypothetical protein qu_869 [Mimivirus sp.]
MPKLSFSDFNDYDNKLKCYLQNKGIEKEFTECKLHGIMNMVDKFNLYNLKDVEQLSFVMWKLRKYFVKLLHNGYLLTRVNFDMFEKKILEYNSTTRVVRHRGMTPLGGLEVDIDPKIFYLDCIKFIGQFTNQQEIYDKCLNILENSQKKLSDNYLPSRIMYLMRYNEYVNVNHNKVTENIFHMNKLSNFYHNVFTITPSQEEQYERYKFEIMEVYHDIARFKSSRYSGQANRIGYVCLTDIMVKNHYHVIDDTDKISYHTKMFRSTTLDSIISKILCEISDQIILPDEELAARKTAREIEKKMNNDLRFISKNDKVEILDVFSNAFICVKDIKYDVEILKRDMLIQLYERGIVDPNSDITYDLMRNAAKNGVLWIVKFLIEKGCPVRNLPPSGNGKKQLHEILTEPVLDDLGFGKKWVAKQTETRINLLNYLIDNHYI